MTVKEMEQALDYMRDDSAKKNKKGMAFIAASIFIWLAVFIIHIMPFEMEKKNLYTWFAVAMLMPMALLFTKILKIKFKNDDNPINSLGILITLMEALYILIVCWVYNAVPDKMIMVLAMVFGGHLLPFGWLYKSKSYMISAVIVTAGSLIIGCIFSSWVLALCMMSYEIIFTICLALENRKL